MLAIIITDLSLKITYFRQSHLIFLSFIIYMSKEKNDTYHRIVMKVNVLIYMKVLVNPHQNYYISSHFTYATRHF